ncbi:MAG TPA: AI-2E family transporter [Verrucomicrobiae bacterium]|jgi:predicted PurR-regulated permease PerM
MNLKPPTENQSRILWFALVVLAFTALTCVGIAAIWGIGKILNLLSPVLWPLAIAAILAYLLDPSVNWLERQKIRRPWAIVIVFIFMIAIVAGVFASIIPQLIDETNTLVGEIPGLTARAQLKLEAWGGNPDDMNQTTNSAPANQAQNPTGKFMQPHVQAPPANVPAGTNSTSPTGTNLPVAIETKQIHKQIVSSAKGWLQQIMPKLGNWMLNLLSKAKSLVDVAVALILIPIYTFYFLREKRDIKKHWMDYLPIQDSRVKDELIFILLAINQYMIAFFRGQVIVSLIGGVLYTIGLFAIGLDYAFLVGFLAVFLLMIPVVGATILCLLAIILTVVQFGDWTHPVEVLCLFVLVQSLESFLYSPRIMGNRVGLHPLMVIVALMVGMTLLGGMLGGILAIPLAAALRVLLFRYVWKKNGTGNSKTQL